MTAEPEPLAADEPAPPASWIDHVEAWGAGLVLAAFRLLPIDAASAVGGALARWLGPLFGVSKRARRNLHAAFPELPDAEIETIVRGMWDNLGRVAAEYPHLRGIKIFDPGGRVEAHGFERFHQAIAAGKRMIIFSGHIANWELGPISIMQAGVPTAFVYRAMNNPIADRMLARLRGDRSEYVPKGAVAARRALAALRRGAHVALLPDQKFNDGIPVPFFGRPAMTPPALAMLALRYDCDVYPLRMERLRGARFRLTVEEKLELPHSGNRSADIAALMASANATLERWIRERPEQWLWLHNRWPD
jgi:Kdo2-lipid IVA lauroyltransferase/acyltransferase